MAAFHFSAKIHSRADGRSAVRSAAYRAAERLYDARAGRTEDYSGKLDLIEAAILAPRETTAWVQDCNELWNRVEAAERGRDSQVAQELEINLPRELSDEENWQLAVDFAREHLVAHGRVCDIAFHMATASDGRAPSHVHILMPTRGMKGDGFGEKHPDCSWKTFIKRRDRLHATGCLGRFCPRRCAGAWSRPWSRMGSSQFRGPGYRPRTPAQAQLCRAAAGRGT